MSLSSVKLDLGELLKYTVDTEFCNIFLLVLSCFNEGMQVCFHFDDLIETEVIAILITFSPHPSPIIHHEKHCQKSLKSF